MTDQELQLRREIMRAFAATGEPPAVDDGPLLADLERRHVVVVRDGRVHMAHPFAAHHDGTRVDSNGQSWWGNCAWDGLGIVASLGLRDAVLTSGPVTLHVRDGHVADDGLFEVAVPARHWWDDIEFT